MHNRSALAAACASAIALTPVPALARDEAAPEGKAAEVAARLNDPLTQYAVAGAISAASKALLEMPVAPMVEAVEKATGRVGDLPPNARLGDLAGLDHARLRNKIVTQVPRAMKAMGAMASAAQAMAPELERMARTMRDSLPKP